MLASDSSSQDDRTLIVAFIDYQCPFCTEQQKILDSLLSVIGDEVSVSYRHYPMPYHSEVKAAAMAVECAREQKLFTPYHDLLYSRGLQRKQSFDWIALAKVVKIPEIPQFATCIREGHTRASLVEDSILAENLGIDGIPTMIVNGMLFDEVLEFSTLMDLLPTTD